MIDSNVGEDVLPRISCGLGGVWGMGMGVWGMGMGMVCCIMTVSKLLVASLSMEFRIE